VVHRRFGARRGALAASAREALGEPEIDVDELGRTQLHIGVAGRVPARVDLTELHVPVLVLAIRRR